MTELVSRLALVAVAWTTPALAQDEDASDEESFDEKSEGSESDDDEGAEGGEEDAKHEEGDSAGGEEDFGHLGQFGVRLGIVWGYRMVFRYDDSPLCAEPDYTDPFEEQQQFCGHAGPFALDLGLSFAVHDAIEPFLWGRVGLGDEPQTNTAPVKIVGAGVRIYTMSDAALKIFVEPAVGFAFEKDAGDDAYESNPTGLAWEQPEYKRDFLFHLAAGPHWDFHKNFGAYLTGGMTVGIVRSINANLELQLGVQGRIP